MWEKIKERGYNITTIGVLGANLVMFILIYLSGQAYINEPSPVILIIEIILTTGWIIWGIERLVRDLHD